MTGIAQTSLTTGDNPIMDSDKLRRAHEILPTLIASVKMATGTEEQQIAMLMAHPLLYGHLQLDYARRLLNGWKP